jgi:asparagine synthase (glutamine-hydrolysing)
LGHRRLAIVDLSPAASQPMTTADRCQALVYNGEIYNHQELRASLPALQFRSHSDTETCLHFLHRNGLKGLVSFNGIFALGFLDLQGRRLLLARDPFGVKPLYYWVQGRRMMFSSELRPIQDYVHDAIDVENLAELLCLRYVPSPDTLFKNIRKLRPGHALTVDLSSEIPVVEESCFTPPVAPALHLSFEEALQRYGELLERAVERQLMSDVEVGVLLSGGIDSAVVAALAQKRTSYRMKAFTVGFDVRSDADEVDQAAETARALGMDHVVVRLGADDFFEDLRKCVAFVEEPIASTSIVPLFHLARRAAADVKVVLSGQGADEAMGGYRRYQLELVKDYLPAGGGGCMARLLSRLGYRNEAMLRGLRAIDERDPPRRILDAGRVFSPQEVERLTGARDSNAIQRLTYFYDLLQCDKQAHSVEAMMSLDLRTSLADELLLYTDKITMRNSLECRVPLLDCDLVSFVESLPHRYRLRIGRGKIIHRRFAEKLIPRSIIQGKKKGFLSPAAWFRDLRPFKEALLSRQSTFASFFDLNAVERVFAEAESGFDRTRQIFLLLSIYHWFNDVYR